MKAANKRWTEEDATFVKNNLGKLSFEQMGRALKQKCYVGSPLCFEKPPYGWVTSQTQYPYGDVEDKIPPP